MSPKERNVSLSLFRVVGELLLVEVVVLHCTWCQIGEGENGKRPLFNVARRQRIAYPLQILSEIIWTRNIIEKSSARHYVVSICCCVISISISLLFVFPQTDQIVVALDVDESARPEEKESYIKQDVVLNCGFSRQRGALKIAVPGAEDETEDVSDEGVVMLGLGEKRENEGTVEVMQSEQNQKSVVVAILAQEVSIRADYVIADNEERGRLLHNPADFAVDAQLRFESVRVSSVGCRDFEENFDTEGHHCAQNHQISEKGD